MTVRIAIVSLALLGAACSSVQPGGTSTTAGFDAGREGIELVLLAAEEDWCNTQEGRAGGWLVADDLFVDDGTDELLVINDESRGLLETVASGGIATIDADDLTQIDTFLRLPLPSATACKIAYDERDR